MIQVIITGHDVNDELQSQIINDMSKVEGHRRTLEYKSLDSTLDANPRSIFIFEFDSLDDSKVSAIQKIVENTASEMKCAVQVRSYELLGSEGFNGECRVPARL